jgi:MFS superfamily sulfate permease-like transporter
MSSWNALAQIEAERAAAARPASVVAMTAPGGIEPTAALAAQLGVGVSAALVLLSPRWRRRIPPPVLLIAAAAVIAYIQTRARPAAIALTVTPQPQRVEVPAPPPARGPVSGFYDGVGQTIYDWTGF